MFRVTLLCFSLFCLLLAPVTGYAEQAYGSGLPAPASEKAWVRAVNLRVKANLAHVYATQRIAGVKIQGNNAALILVVAADGTIREVTIAKSSGQPDLDESLLRAVRNIPQLPAFTPDMTEATIQLKLPVRGATRP